MARTARQPLPASRLPVTRRTHDVIGQGGLGKTRLALWLAICQITGREWCGLPTGGEPQKWLFLGDENSIARWQADLKRMLSTLKAEEVRRVDELLRLPALEEMGDCDIWLGDPTTQARVELTIAQEAAGAVVADPLGNFAPDDISKPGPMKEAVRRLLGIVRRSAPKATLLTLHHARTGRQNIAQGVGYDSPNFASGGKPLFAAARCQMNLMPGSAEDDTRLVLSCAKSNNCERFAVRGLRFDPQTFTYGLDPDFAAAAWQADVLGKANGKPLMTSERVAELCRLPMSKAELVHAIREDCGCPRQVAYRHVKRAEICRKINLNSNTERYAAR